MGQSIKPGTGATKLVMEPNAAAMMGDDGNRLDPGLLSQQARERPVGRDYSDGGGLR